MNAYDFIAITSRYTATKSALRADRVFKCSEITEIKKRKLKTDQISSGKQQGETMCERIYLTDVTNINSKCYHDEGHGEGGPDEDRKLG